jgi:hypothetical protein
VNGVLFAQHGAGSIEEVFISVRIWNDEGVSGLFDICWLTI